MTIRPWTVACILTLELVTASVTPARPAPAATSERPPSIQFFQDVAWSPDGEWVAFSGYAGSAEEYQGEKWAVFVARPDGSELRTILENAQWVSWSPDGERLALSSPRSGNRDLWLVGRDGTGLERLTSHEAPDSAPSWSPQGDEIAFTSTRDGNHEIYVTNLADGTVRRVTDHPEADHNPAWSADGEHLVFYRSVGDGGADQIYRITSRGTDEEPLTADGHLNIFPSSLPDGRVAFARKRQGAEESRLVVLDPATTAVTPTGPAGAFFGRWSPDGSEVLFIAGTWPRAALYRMRADGTEVRRILGTPSE